MTELTKKRMKKTTQQGTEVLVITTILVKISVVVMMAGALVAGFGFLAPLIFGPIEPSEPEEPVLSGPGDEFRCVDSDGRRNFKIKGTVTHYQADGSESWAMDRCVPTTDDSVVDYYCTGMGGGDIMLKGASIDLEGGAGENEQLIMAPEFANDSIDCSDVYGSGWDCDDGACFYTPWCGDGHCNGDEECDLCVDCGLCACGDYQCAGNEDCLNCEDDCGECQECGDGIATGTEECDGNDLDGATCLVASGIDSDGLSCNSDCTFNITECFFCDAAKDRGIDGDVNNDKLVDAADLVYLIDYIYNNGPAPCNVPTDYKAPDITTKQEVLTYLFESQQNSISGMPPHPDLLKKVEQGIAELPDFMTDPRSARQSGINQPGPLLNLKSLPKSRSGGDVWEFKTVALLIEYPDKSATLDETYFNNLLYSTNPASGSMRQYYRDNSYGQLDMVAPYLPSAINGPGGSIGWQEAPHNYSYYAKGRDCETSTLCRDSYQYGVGCWPCNSQGMAKDIVTMLDPWIDFSVFDDDGDGFIDELILVHAGNGAEAGGSSNDIWSHKWSIPNDFCALDSRGHGSCEVDEDCIDNEVDYGPCIRNNRPVLDGVTIRDYTIQPEKHGNNPVEVGVYVHETGHMIGLPDLYDTDYSSNGVGKWSVMAYGSWLGPGNNGEVPSNLDAWSKAQLGFVDPINIVIQQNLPACINFPSVTDSKYSSLRVWTDNDNTGQQYFLAENRQKTGWDQYLPASGLLIWQVDEAVFTKNNREWFPGVKRCVGGGDDNERCTSNYNCESNVCEPDNEHYLVALEQADSMYELDRGNDIGDAGDPFPGNFSNNNFSSSTGPSSNDYFGNDTSVSITNISYSQQTMTADISVNSSKQSDLPKTCGDINNDGLVTLDDFWSLFEIIFGK